MFGPELVWKPWITGPIFRSAQLDFANSHFYEEGTIDDPKDTVAPALAVGQLVIDALGQIEDGRPFFETEHGPIHTFKDHKKTLPAMFDDEYFRHIQWAHLASGGVGGGMRWPNRKPHTLTPGMRRAQHALSGFLPLVDWARFRREPLNARLRVDTPDLAAFGCGDGRQAVVFLLRRAPMLPDGRVSQAERPGRLDVPGLRDGRCSVVAWDTRAGRERARWSADSRAGRLTLDVPAFGGDVALAIRLHEGAGAPDMSA